MPILLLILAAAWCAYLAFWWRDSRKAAMLAAPDSVDRLMSFQAGMNTLGNSSTGSHTFASSDLASPDLGSSGPRRVPGAASLQGLHSAGLPMPRSVAAAAERRRNVLVFLGAAAVLSLLLTMVFGWWVLLAHLLIDAALGAYGYACVRRRNLAAEREIKVQMLYPEGVVPLHSAGYSHQGVPAAADSPRMQTG